MTIEHENGNLIEIPYCETFQSINEIKEFINKEVNKWNEEGYYKFCEDAYINKDNTFNLKAIWLRKGE